MPATGRTYIAWRKPSRSNDQDGNYVEIGFTHDGSGVGIRDTREAVNPGTSILEVSRASWGQLIDAIRRGSLS